MAQQMTIMAARKTTMASSRATGTSNSSQRIPTRIITRTITRIAAQNPKTINRPANHLIIPAHQNKTKTTKTEEQHNQQPRKIRTSPRPQSSSPKTRRQSMRYRLIRK